MRYWWIVLAAGALLSACYSDEFPRDNPNDPDGISFVDDDADKDGFAAGEDCNDEDAAINPDAKEVCNSVDDDCDGETDNGLDFVVYYLDDDGDGYGDAESGERCDGPKSGEVVEGGDCNDNDKEINPGANERCNDKDDDCNDAIDDGLPTSTYYPDADGDEYGDEDAPSTHCGLPDGNETNVGGDCDDSDPDINPGAAEECGGTVDTNCDDNIRPSQTWYRDFDGDGYGDPGYVQQACKAPTGGVDKAGDCDDENPAVHEGVEDICDGIDNDCDGVIDGGLSHTYYPDQDGDSFGTGAGISSCTPLANYATQGGDCDDTHADVNPLATESCNGVDDDCDNQIDEDVKNLYFADGDGDGYGDPTVSKWSCTQPRGYVPDPGDPLKYDCNDSNARINPEVAEICDGFDQNCNGEIDEGVKNTYYIDADGDGYGDPELATEKCIQPEGASVDGTDCNDKDPTIHPGATEICGDGIVQSCGAYDPGCGEVDKDGDGYTELDWDCDDTNAQIYPGAPETPYNGVDEDCNGADLADVDEDGYDGGLNGTDCRDDDASTYPGADEVCDGGDNNCDGVANNKDADRDGGYDSACGGDDCNDDDPMVYTGADELCDNLDNDCDTLVDEGWDKLVYYDDADLDGYGDETTATKPSCDPIEGKISIGGDCDDANSKINPGATEILDGTTDDDCSGKIDDNIVLEDISTALLYGDKIVEPAITSIGRKMIGAELDGNVGLDILFKVQKYSSGNSGTFLLWSDTDLENGDGTKPTASFFDGENEAASDAAVADFNADGLPDVAIFGVYTVDGVGHIGVCFYFGTTEGFHGSYTSGAANVFLEDRYIVNPSALIVLGDVDHNGAPELVIADPTASNATGIVTIAELVETKIPGSELDPPQRSETAFVGKVLMQIVGSQEGVAFGTAMAATNAVDSDPFLWISAPGDAEETGMVYWIYPSEWVGYLDGSPISIESLEPGRIQARSGSILQLGKKLVAINDVDSDGYDDLLVKTATNNGVDRVYLLPGYRTYADWYITLEEVGLPLSGEEKVVDVGKDMVGLGDMDYDGNDDFAIACMRYVEGGAQAEIWLYHGWSREQMGEPNQFPATGASLLGPKITGSSIIALGGGDLERGNAPALLVGLPGTYSETGGSDKGRVSVLIDPYPAPNSGEPVIQRGF